MYRDTELIILNFYSFNIFGTFNKGSKNLPNIKKLECYDSERLELAF